jgi:hypothetical protein
LIDLHNVPDGHTLLVPPNLDAEILVMLTDNHELPVGHRESRVSAEPPLVIAARKSA